MEILEWIVTHIVTHVEAILIIFGVLWIIVFVLSLFTSPLDTGVKE